MSYEVKAIARAKIKTDKRDSEVLAHLLRMNMIPEVYRRSTENRQAQRVLRQRAFYVSAMTALKNRDHAFLAQQREEIREVVARETNIFSEKGQKAMTFNTPPHWGQTIGSVPTLRIMAAQPRRGILGHSSSMNRNLEFSSADQ